MTSPRSLISATSNPLLQRALEDKLARRSEATGSLGELEPLAIRLGLMQNTLKPRLREPQLVVFASDHGLAVDGLPGVEGRSTSEHVAQLLSGQLALAVFARIEGMELTVVDAGVAQALPAHDRLLRRKIAHGTRNARVGPAMSVEQAHAAIRAGMEIGDALRGNVVACAGIGVGSHESASLVLARLTDTPVRALLLTDPKMDPQALARLMVVTQSAQGRHREVRDPIEVLAAFGGFEMAMMAGVMLVAASKRHLVMVDGVPACAALMVAARIAAAVTDYCVFCRSHGHQGLDEALHLFRASSLLELGMESTDGTGAALAWPLLQASAALLTELAEGEDAGPSRPGGIATEVGPLRSADGAGDAG